MQLRWRLSHIRGYLELGMIAEAEAELASLSPEAREQTDVLEVTVQLYQETKRWPEASRNAGELCRRHPQSPGCWVMYAYATRRAVSLEAAEQILRQAIELHPDDPTISFNLGCYACQRGDIGAADLLVRKAISLDDRFRNLAETDDDLSAWRAQR